jgi:hypothetical protein
MDALDRIAAARAAIDAAQAATEAAEKEAARAEAAVLDAREAVKTRRAEAAKAAQALSDARQVETRVVDEQQAVIAAAEEAMRIILHSGGSASPDAPANAITTLRLTSPVGGTLPFTVAQFFADGDAPQYVSAPGCQVTVMTRWDSGCVKTAVVAGLVALLAGTPSVLQLSTSSAPAAGSDVTTAALAAHSVTFTGPGGTATFSGADWDAGEEWIAGPVMSSWVFSKAMIGTLVAWLEVRVFADGHIEWFPWVENGDLLSVDQASKAGTYTCTIDGVQVCSASIDLPARCRTPLINGTALSYWSGADPQVTPKHNTDYLMSTGLVPRYAGRPTDTRVAQLVPLAYTPLQQGSFPGSMGVTGYHASIGLLPEWDVLYLTNDSDRAFPGVVRNGFSAGRYPIHHRHLGHILRPEDHPYLSADASSKNILTPVSTGTKGPTWKYTHHPSVGFMAYLVTGRRYFVEELHFAVSWSYLDNTDGNRGRQLGLLLPEKMAARGSAWSLRTLAQAVCVTPAAHPRATDLATLLTNNGNHFHATYVAGTHNDFGFLRPYSVENVTGGVYGAFQAGSPWMHDFWISAVGYLKSMGVGSVKWTEVFHWVAQMVVNRLGPLEGHLYRDAAVYRFPIAPVIGGVAPNWITGAGPWYPNWGEIWSDSRVVNDTTHYLKEIGDGSLRGTSASAPISSTGYWANLLPAIAYAIDHGAEGAVEARARMTGAPNYSGITSGFNTSPVWSVVPRLSA